MACCLLDTKPLSKPKLGYYQLDPYEESSVKFWSKYKTFYSWKRHLKISSAKWRPCYPGGRWVKIGHRKLQNVVPHGADMNSYFGRELSLSLQVSGLGALAPGDYQSSFSSWDSWGCWLICLLLGKHLSLLTFVKDECHDCLNQRCKLIRR